MFNVQFPKLGLSFQINRIAFTIGGIDIYWYGVIIAVGVMLCLLIGFKLAEKRNINVDKFTDIVLVSAFGAIIGARAYYVIFAPFEYQSFYDVINLRDGGLAIYGGLIGGLLVGIAACKWRKVDPLEFCDVVSSCFLLGQGIGRWGNFVNQEAFGTNTDSIFGMISEGTTRYLNSVKDTLALQGITVDPNMPVHPTFLYESVWCIIGFVLMMLYFDRKKFKGEMLCFYGIWYGIGRFFIEGLRTDSLEIIPGLRASQLVAAATVAVSLAVIVYMRRKLKNNTAETDNENTQVKKEEKGEENNG